MSEVPNAVWLLSLLALVALIGATVLWRRRRQKAVRMQQAMALAPEAILATLKIDPARTDWLYAVSVSSGAGGRPETLVRDGRGEMVGRITTPADHRSVVRVIACEDGDHECHRIIGMSADRVSLQRAGSDAIRMQYEAATHVEAYRANGETLYERRPMALSAPGRWRVDSRGETVALMADLGADFGLRVLALVPTTDMPLIDRLFLLAMSEGGGPPG
ncbi:MAG: hypothetical protein KDG55_08585 [Rhodocyclaceae bacterium]|nr:hypothetical protein [Rhodocyclaceae bacterium]